MFHVKRIISPTDFSDPSLEGFRAAIGLAKQFDAEILLTHVIETQHWPGVTFYQPPPAYNLPDIITSIREETVQNLNQLQTSMIPETVRSRIIVLEGVPADEIVRLAETESADLIVIATHGHSGFHRLLSGSVTERVVRTSECPVLTIRPKEMKKAQK